MITITIKIENESKIFECIVKDIPDDNLDDRIEDIKNRLKRMMDEEKEKVGLLKQQN